MKLAPLTNFTEFETQIKPVGKSYTKLATPKGVYLLDKFFLGYTRDFSGDNEKLGEEAVKHFSQKARKAFESGKVYVVGYQRGEEIWYALLAEREDGFQTYIEKLDKSHIEELLEEVAETLDP